MRRSSHLPWIAALMLAATALAGAGLVDAAGGAAAENARTGSAPLTGGEFSLSPALAVAANPRGGGFELRPIATDGGALSPTGSLCFCASVLFSDGFESGNTGAWDETGP